MISQGNYSMIFTALGILSWGVLKTDLIRQWLPQVNWWSKHSRILCLWMWTCDCDMMQAAPVDPQSASTTSLDLLFHWKAPSSKHYTTLDGPINKEDSKIEWTLKWGHFDGVSMQNHCLSVVPAWMDAACKPHEGIRPELLLLSNNCNSKYSNVPRSSQFWISSTVPNPPDNLPFWWYGYPWVIFNSRLSG